MASTNCIVKGVRKNFSVFAAIYLCSTRSTQVTKIFRFAMWIRKGMYLFLKKIAWTFNYFYNFYYVVLKLQSPKFLSFLYTRITPRDASLCTKRLLIITTENYHFMLKMQALTDIPRYVIHVQK